MPSTSNLTPADVDCMMGKWLILLVMVCLCAQVAIAQKQSLFARPYHVSTTKATIRNFLDDVNANSGIVIEYSTNNIDTGKLISLSGRPATIGHVLQQVLKGQLVSVVEKNNKIILVPSLTPLPDNAFSLYYSVYGIIKEKNSEEPLIEATIWDATSSRGTLSNAQGYFTLQLPEGKHTLRISYVGHTPRTLEINLESDQRVDAQLEPQNIIDEIVVTSDKKDNQLILGQESLTENMQTGTDALSSMYMLPGVQNTPEITNGTLVRGGSPDQNVFLMDGNTIFNPTHLLGTISIIDKTSLKYMHLYKSNFPARYGGRLSSVMDVVTREGNMQKWAGEANVGLMAGSFTVEGPIKRDKASLMLSVRHSWVNPILELVKAGMNIDFYDIHLKYTQVLSSRDKLLVSGYAGHDKLTLLKDNTNNQQQWGNKAASLTWNHLLGPQAFITSSVHASSYNNIAGFRYNLYDSTGVNIQKRVYNTFSSIAQYSAQTGIEYSPVNTVKFLAGLKASSTRIKPFDTNISEDFADRPEEFNSVAPLTFYEVEGYYENEIRLGKFFIRPGLHVAEFKYKDFHYLSWQPRFYTVYKLNHTHQFNFSYNHMTQFMHLVTNPYLGINSDVWVPSTHMLAPEESNMVNVGYTYNAKKNLKFGAEVYYKQMRNVTNNAEGKNLFLNTDNWEENIQSGKGWTYGLELKARKQTARWEAYASYTLAWNWRQFKDINEGKKFPFKYDRRHDVNIYASYILSSRWSFAASWSFATGDVFTLPNRIYADFDDAQQITDPLAPKEYRLIYHSSAANQYRTLPYHRLDISATWHHAPFKNTKGVFTAGVYNLYGSPNQYVYDLEGTLGKRSLVVTTKYDFFNVIPYISYSISF
ncbi:MAG: TonB-dependent receptor [Chitinophagaceae bacterium]